MLREDPLTQGREGAVVVGQTAAKNTVVSEDGTRSIANGARTCCLGW